jgi:hypothetical protein
LVEESPLHYGDLNGCCRNLTDHPVFHYCPIPPSTQQQHYKVPTPATLPTKHNRSESSNPSRQQFSHSRRQRFSRTQTKKSQTEIQLQIQWENQHFTNQLIREHHSITTAALHRFPSLPLPTLTIHKNARLTLGNTHVSDYIPNIKKLAFHDLTSSHKLPACANQLLGLGLKFIPTPKTNTSQDMINKITERFERDLNLRIFFSDDNTNDYDPHTLRIKSSWRAPLPPLDIDQRMCTFTKHIHDTFTPSTTASNLSRQQRDVLLTIKSNKNITILSADKGLGPVGVDTKQYIEWALHHLTDNTTYTILNDNDAATAAQELYHTIFTWTLRHHNTIGADNTKYIRRQIEIARKDPFGYFYLLAKLHKTPISTRPVCSDCASLPHSVGKWIDRQLQPIVQCQQTYFKNSFELKRLLTQLTLPSNACLFTYDAISMYTNINTEQCLHRLTTFLTDQQTITTFPHLTPEPLVEALHIVMNNNRMKFGDIFAHQHKGIAMGMAPAPSIANLFVAIYEEAYITTFLSTPLRFLKRFIDDGFGIWLRDPDPEQDKIHWDSFQSIINNMGLQWEFTQRSDTVVFMDLNIRLHNGHITTSLYAKPLALNLYIPPSSCHMPGLLTGLIYGHFHRVTTLCTHRHDIESELSQFFRRLVDRGHSPTHLIPLFLSAETKIQANLNTRSLQHQHPPARTNDNTFLHLQYHPSNPNSGEIQRLWRSNILTPPNKPPLYKLRNREGYPINIKRLTIAYSRAPNLGNILSCRILRAKIGDYIDKTHYPSLFPNDDTEELPPSSQTNNSCFSG